MATTGFGFALSTGAIDRSAEGVCAQLTIEKTLMHRRSPIAE
jgi:hypothetical protein